MLKNRKDTCLKLIFHFHYSLSLHKLLLIQPETSIPGDHLNAVCRNSLRADMFGLVKVCFLTWWHVLYSSSPHVHLSCVDGVVFYKVHFSCKERENIIPQLQLLFPTRMNDRKSSWKMTLCLEVVHRCSKFVISSALPVHNIILYFKSWHRGHKPPLTQLCVCVRLGVHSIYGRLDVTHVSYAHVSCEHVARDVKSGSTHNHGASQETRTAGLAPNFMVINGW